MGRVVFRNSAPFLRVRRGEVAALQNEEEFDALDDIRLNTEDEGLLQVGGVQRWLELSGMDYKGYKGYTTDSMERSTLASITMWDVCMCS